MADLQLGQVDWIHVKSTVGTGGMDPWQIYTWARWNGSKVDLQFGPGGMDPR